MTTRPYRDCLADALALCGIPDANTVEVARIGRFLNMAFRRAYSESDYWPRWLRTEERIVSEDGLLPYSQTGLEDIAVVRRIHATEPFATEGAAEYPSYYGLGDGIQIAGYVAREASGGQDMIVTGDINPDLTGTYRPDGTTTVVTEEFIFYRSIQNPNYTLSQTGGGWVITDIDPIAGYPIGDYFLSDPDDFETPADANGTYVGHGAATGSPVVTAETIYSAWVTYKASFDMTYGTGDGQTDEVPEEWADFAIYDAYGRFLSQDGNKEAGIAECQLAFNTYLVPQLERLDNQSGGHVFTRNVNHGNTQAR